MYKLAIPILLILSSSSFGHGGGLDRYGGHHDRKSGGYHFHRLVFSSGRSTADQVRKFQQTRESTSPNRSRSTARTTARNSSRSTARTTARSLSRLAPRRATIWEFSAWKRRESGDIEPAAFEELPDEELEYTFLEQFHATGKSFDMSRFVIAYAGERRDQLVGAPPPIEDIENHMQGLHFKKGTVLYFLNGMNLKKVAWAHGELHGDSMDLRHRDVDSRELQTSRLVVDVHELRKWTDNTGNYTVLARFLSYGNKLVTLRKETGRRVVVPMNRLSDADRTYVNELLHSMER